MFYRHIIENYDQKGEQLDQEYQAVTLTGREDQLLELAVEDRFLYRVSVKLNVSQILNLRDALTDYLTELEDSVDSVSR